MLVRKLQAYKKEVSTKMKKVKTLKLNQDLLLEEPEKILMIPITKTEALIDFAK